MKRKEDLVDDFYHIAKNMVKNSNGKISIDQDFLKLDGQIIGEHSISVLGKMLINGEIGGGLSYFFLIVSNIKMDCPVAYKIATIDLRELGNKVLKDPYLRNWNFLFMKQ